MTSEQQGCNHWAAGEWQVSIKGAAWLWHRNCRVRVWLASGRGLTSEQQYSKKLVNLNSPPPPGPVWWRYWTLPLTVERKVSLWRTLRPSTGRPLEPRDGSKLNRTWVPGSHSTPEDTVVHHGLWWSFGLGRYLARWLTNVDWCIEFVVAIGIVDQIWIVYAMNTLWIFETRGLPWLRSQIPGLRNGNLEIIITII